jgi:hypothetical protein
MMDRIVVRPWDAARAASLIQLEIGRELGGHAGRPACDAMPIALRCHCTRLVEASQLGHAMAIVSAVPTVFWSRVSLCMIASARWPSRTRSSGAAASTAAERVIEPGLIGKGLRVVGQMVARLGPAPQPHQADRVSEARLRRQRRRGHGRGVVR